ncbi:MAG: CRISPR-associated protein Cas4 [Pyrinomonadaceae bacterium]
MEVVSISSINQYEFCPRRCALVLIEGVWADNSHTLAGALIHNQVDTSGYETRRGVTLLRALPLFSHNLGISGKADIVELHGEEYVPVEYKKGAKRKFVNDDMQLAAQAMCLEEMFSTSVKKGYIYHAKSNKRRKVLIDAKLREKVLAAISNIRTMLTSEKVPSAEYSKRCDECSIYSFCIPKLSDTAEREKLMMKYEQFKPK